MKRRLSAIPWLIVNITSVLYENIEHTDALMDGGTHTSIYLFFINSLPKNRIYFSNISTANQIS